jgi:hypothetical protein
MISPLVALLLAAAPAAPSSSRWMAEGERGLDAALAGWASRPLPERLRKVSDGFLGTPYGFSPLGEGPGHAPDPDPLFRLDLADCLTFAEEVMALALSRDVASAQPLLERIRYRWDRPAGPDHAFRNHITEADWVVSNARQGFVRDITARVGGADAVDAPYELTAAHWDSEVGRRLQLVPERQARGSFPLKVVPLERAVKRLGAAPPGTLLLVVREPRDTLPTRVSHVAWLFRDGRKTFVRHASQVKGRVVDEPLAQFVAAARKHAKWRVKGYALFEVLAPAS